MNASALIQRRTAHCFFAAVLILAPSLRAAAPPNSVEAEVVQNILNDAAGPTTTTALGLRPEFIARVADHIIVESFLSRYRIVAPDGTPWPPTPTSQPGSRPSEPPAWMRVERVAPASASAAMTVTPPMRDEFPALRGYHAAHPAIFGPNPFAEIAESDPFSRELTAARNAAAESLAREGLLLTTRAALQALPPEAPRDSEARARLLARIGLPVDLLAHFSPPQTPAAPLDHVAQAACERLQNAALDDVETLVAHREAPGLAFQPHAPDATWKPRLDTGEEPVTFVRAQLPRGDCWLGPGGGGAVDVLRQLIESGIAPYGIALIRDGESLRALEATAHGWHPPKDARLYLLAADLQPDQWTRDSGRAGTVIVDGRVVGATLVPRYPSRSEHASKFVAADLAALRRFEQSGHRLVPSSLLFQGGNLLAYRDPKTERMHLLVGEAEIARNVALGLSESQAKALFSAEFDKAEVHVLPAVGFHLDLEISIRREGQRLLAFVNDANNGALLVVRAAIPALQQAKLLDAGEVELLTKALDAADTAAILRVVMPSVQKGMNGLGAWPLQLTMPFATSAVDSPVGNFQRLLYAVDLLLAEQIDLREVANDPFTQAYYGALQRRAAGRTVLQQMLKDFGFEIVLVPGWAEARVCLAYVNALQTPDAVVLSTYGGLFAPVDEAAIRAVRSALPETTRVIGILSGESQCRFGGVHCSVIEY